MLAKLRKKKQKKKVVEDVVVDTPILNQRCSSFLPSSSSDDDTPEVTEMVGEVSTVSEECAKVVEEVIVDTPVMVPVSEVPPVIDECFTPVVTSVVSPDLDFPMDIAPAEGIFESGVKQNGFLAKHRRRKISVYEVNIAGTRMTKYLSDIDLSFLSDSISEERNLVIEELREDFDESFENEKVIVENSEKYVIDENGLVMADLGSGAAMIGGMFNSIVNYIFLKTSDRGFEDLLNTFLVMYRKFMSTPELLRELFKFSGADIDGLTMITPEELNNRFITVLEILFKDHYHEFLVTSHYDLLRSLIESEVYDKGMHDKILNLLDENEKNHYEAINHKFTSPPPNSITPKSANFEDFDLVEVARQLSLLDQEKFREIKPSELINQTWSKEKQKAPHISAMIDRFNTVSLFFTTYICSKDTLKERTKALKKVITIMYEASKINNFNLCQMFLSCLGSSAIYRLELSWSRIGKKHLTWFKEISLLLSPNKSYKNLRTAMITSKPPCICYLGIYLSDLTFIGDGISSYFDDNNEVVNFEKMKQEAEVINEIRHQQKFHYNFKIVNTIRYFFENIIETKSRCLSQEENFNRSREIEPRSMIADQLNHSFSENLEISKLIDNNNTYKVPTKKEIREYVSNEWLQPILDLIDTSEVDDKKRIWEKPTWKMRKSTLDDQDKTKVYTRNAIFINGKVVKIETTCRVPLENVLDLVDYNFSNRLHEWKTISECICFQKIDDNIELHYRRIDTGRDIVVARKRIEHEGEYIFIEKSIEHGAYPPQSGVKRMDLPYTLCILRPINESTTFMIYMKETNIKGRISSLKKEVIDLKRALDDHHKITI